MRGLPTLRTCTFADADLAKFKNVAIQSELGVEWVVATFPEIEQLFICVEIFKQPRLEYSKVPGMEGAPRRKYKMPWHQRVLYRMKHLRIYTKLKWGEWQYYRHTGKWDRVRDQWTFLEADVSELQIYRVRHGSNLRWLFNSNHLPFPRDYFESVSRELEARIRCFRNPNFQPGPTPRVRIGIVVPECAVPSLKEAREQYWNNEQATADVSSPGHIETAHE